MGYRTMYSAVVLSTRTTKCRVQVRQVDLFVSAVHFSAPKMKSFAVATTLAVAASATPMEYARIVKQVNSNPASTWAAEQPTRFNSTADAKQLCGTWLKGHPSYFRLPEREEDESFKVAKPEDIPTDFDARTTW